MDYEELRNPFEKRENTFDGQNNICFLSGKRFSSGWNTKNRMTIFSALNCEIHSTDRIISAWYMINRTSPSLFSFNRKDSRYLYALRRIEWLYLPRAANYEIHSKREYSEWSTERKLVSSGILNERIFATLRIVLRIHSQKRGGTRGDIRRWRIELV